MSRFASFPIVAAIGVFAGCTHDLAPPARPIARLDAPVEREAVERGPSEYEAEIGGLSQEDFERELRAAEPELRDCVDRAASSVSYLGGRVSLRMRVDRRGNVRWAYLKETTLGDRDTERCVLSVVKGRTWPRPLSGEGLAETSFDVDAADPPPSLPTSRTPLLAQRASAVTRKCRKGTNGGFTATAYFGPSGELLSVGVAPPDEQGELAADCIAQALRDLRVENRGVRPPPASKVSFRIP